MLQQEVADSYLPLIANWLNGVEVKFEKRSPHLDFILADSNFGKDGLSIDAKDVIGVRPGNFDDLFSVSENTIAVIPLKGVMLKYGDWCSYGTVEYANLIRVAASVKNISGIVLDVDTGGGSVNAIWPMVDAIRFAQKIMNKPVVSHGDLVASAGIYVNVFTDYRFADNSLSSQYGSIGVMTDLYDYSKRLEDMGVKRHVIYADPSGAKNKEHDEALKDNYKPIKENILNPLAIRFQNDVKTNLPRLNTDAPDILNGAMFFGDDAVRYGLADEIGNIDAAIAKCFQLAEIRKFMSN
jgi:protease-4